MHKLGLPITLGVLAATGTAWAGLNHNNASYNSSAWNGTTTNSSAWNGTTTNSSAWNGTTTNSSAWNGTTTNSSAWNGTTTNGSTPNQLANSRTGLHADTVHAANGRLWLR